jgi:hypothetical protein
MDLYDKISELGKRRGIIFPSFEIYGGSSGFFDYGPIGTLLKHNVEDKWREIFVHKEGMVEIESKIKCQNTTDNYFQDADLLIAADCVPFAYPDFHQDFLKGKALVVGCPKLDDIQLYKEKLTAIFKTNSIKSVTVPFMEVPCCFGLVKATEDAIKASGNRIPLRKVKIGIRGDIKPEMMVEYFIIPMPLPPAIR